MSCLPRNKVFRRRHRRKKATSSFFRRIGRFFSALFSFLPCVTHPDVVQSWTNYSDTEDEEGMHSDDEVIFNEKSYEIRRNGNPIAKVIRRSDSLLETISEGDTPVPDDVDSDYGDEDSVFSAGFQDTPRPETRVLGPAPEVIDCSDHRSYSFYGKEKTRFSTVDGDIAENSGFETRAMRCATPFKVPMMQLSFSKMAEDTIISDVESLEEVRIDTAPKEKEMEQPVMQDTANGQNRYLYCGTDNDSDIEELQEITYPENNFTEPKPNEEPLLDLMVAGTACFTPINQPSTPPNVPQCSSLTVPQRPVRTQIMSAKANKEIDRILLGYNKDVDEGRCAVITGEVQSGEKKKKGKKLKKTKKEKKKEKNEDKDTILGPLPPLPTAKFGIQVGTWVGNENTDKEIKSKIKKEKKEKEKKEKKERKEQEKRAKKEKKEKKKKKKDLEVHFENDSQMEEKLPTDSEQVIDMGLDEGEKQEMVRKYILSLDAYGHGEMWNEDIGFDEMQKGTKEEGNAADKKEEKKSKKKDKKKKQKKKSVGQKIGEALSELLHDSYVGKQDADDVDKKQKKKKKSGKKEKKPDGYLEVEKFEGKENEGETTATAEIDDDFFHPRHRPTSKERPPGRGNPHKGGLFLIDTPITPPEIVRNETVGHCCRYCDYLEKLHQRNLEMMTPHERQLADEEERRMKQEEIHCKRRLQAYCQEGEVNLIQKQQAVNRDAEIMNRSRKYQQRSETRRMIFVQPINAVDYDDYDDFIEVRGLLHNYFMKTQLPKTYH